MPRNAHAQLYVTDGPAGVVRQYEATTGAAVNANFITVLTDPDGLAVSDNTLFVANPNTVGKYDPITGAAINASFITGLTHPNPRGLAVVGNTLFVPTYFGHTVGKYDRTTGAAIRP